MLVGQAEPDHDLPPGSSRVWIHLSTFQTDNLVLVYTVPVPPNLKAKHFHPNNPIANLSLRRIRHLASQLLSS